MSKIRVSGFTKESVTDGPGIRAVLFTQGCPHCCPGCHNPSTWNYEGGYEIEVEDIINLIQPNRLLQGLTISGGEPFAQANEAADLAARIQGLGLDVVTYSGYTFEQLVEMGENDPAVRRLLEVTDILIDGGFRLEERDLSLAFRGSRNQRIINLKETLKTGELALLEY